MSNQQIQRSVLVMGGGLGGLALAQGLKHTGWDVRVFERDAGPDSRSQGFRISIDPLGFGALKALLTPQLFARVRALESKGVGRGFAFADGGSLQPRYVMADSADGSATISRPGLRSTLAHGVEVEWGKRMLSFVDVGGQVEARFADGSTARADLLVGADGVGSSVREVMARSHAEQLPKVVPAGFSTVGGAIERTAAWEARLALCRAGAVQYIGPQGQAMFVSFCEGPQGEPVILWGLSYPAGERGETWQRQADNQAGREALRRECQQMMQHAGWHPVLRDLVQTTPPSHLIEPLVLKSTRFPSKFRRTLWPSSRVTLLGDAAHTMPPQRGIGGNCALADAQLLVAALTASPTQVTDAVARYESAMLARGKQLVKESEEACGLVHFRNPVARAARWAGFGMMQLVKSRSVPNTTQVRT